MNLDFAIEFVAQEGTFDSGIANSIKTGDFSIFIICALLMLCTVLVGLLCYKFKPAFEAKHACGSSRFSNNTKFNLMLSAFVVFATLCMASLGIAISQIPAVANGEIQTPASVKAYVNGQTGELKLENSWMENVSDENFDIVNSGLTQTDEAKAITDLSNSHFTMNGLGGVIFDGSPDIEFTPTGTSAFLAHEKVDTSFTLSGVSFDDACKLLGHKVFTIHLDIDKFRVKNPMLITEPVTFDTQLHVAILDSPYYVIEGTKSARLANEYTVNVKLNDGFIWWDNTTEAKTFEWEISKLHLDDCVVTWSVDDYVEYDATLKSNIPTITYQGKSLDLTPYFDFQDCTKTEIGSYTAIVKGQYGEDNIVGSAQCNWKIQGAYAHIEEISSIPPREKITFMYGTGFDSGDFYVLEAVNATKDWEIPWRAHNNFIQTVVFDSSLKQYEVSQLAWWFQGCHNLKTFENWENLNLKFDINKRGMESTFNGCEALTTIDLSQIDTSNCPSFCWMFNECEALDNPSLEINTSSASDLNAMFKNCKGLTTLNLSSFVTTNVKNFQSMFDSCTKLTSLNLSNFDMSNAENLSLMFSMPYDEGEYGQSSKLTSVTFNSNMKIHKVKTLEMMFYSCGSLTNLDLSFLDTSLVTKFHDMFCCCGKLVTIKVSTEFVTTAEDEESHSMFWHCKVLTGGAGTPYDDIHFNSDYACIDNAPTKPGYFTEA